MQNISISNTFEDNAFSRHIYISNHPQHKHKHRETNARKSPKNLSRLSPTSWLDGRTIDNSRSQSNRPVQFMNRGTIVNRATPFVFRLAGGRTKGARNCRDFALYESINAWNCVLIVSLGVVCDGLLTFRSNSDARS